MTTPVIYPGPYEAVELPDGTICTRGVPVEVDERMASDLIRQGFTIPTPTKTKEKDAD